MKIIEENSNGITLLKTPLIQCYNTNEMELIGNQKLDL